jgi:DnaJ-class molecular chaperone
MDFDAKDTPGDLVLIMKQRPHATFTRKGHDLAISVKVSLKEAICGVHRTIRHLDGRNVVFASARRNDDDAPILIKTGDVQVLKGQGMPKNARGTEFGDLYVQYNVAVPTTAARQEMTPNERAELGRLLDKLEGKQSSVEENNDSNVDVLTQGSVSDFGIASGTPEVPRDPTSMEEEGPGFSPFGTSSRQFYFPSGSSNPFSGMRQGPMYEEDDSNVQCRQM